MFLFVYGYPTPPKFRRQKKILGSAKKFQLEKKFQKACIDRAAGRLKGDHSSSRCEFNPFPVSNESAPIPNNLQWFVTYKLCKTVTAFSRIEHKMNSKVTFTVEIRVENWFLDSRWSDVRHLCFRSRNSVPDSDLFHFSSFDHSDEIKDTSSH